MKLLKIKLDKRVKNTTSSAIRQILEKYPKASNDDIYGTLVKSGYSPAYKSIGSYRSGFNKEKQIKALLGVK